MKFYNLILASLMLVFVACQEEEVDPFTPNVSGTVTFDTQSFTLEGGLLDEKADSLLNRRTFAFKISDQRIHPRDSFELYTAADEEINIQFDLTSDNLDAVIKNGAYTFSGLRKDAATFPAGLIMHQGMVSVTTKVGSGIQANHYSVTGGTVSIQGTFPDYTLEFSLTTDHGSVNGSVNGQFITRASWDDVFGSYNNNKPRYF